MLSDTSASLLVVAPLGAMKGNVEAEEEEKERVGVEVEVVVEVEVGAWCWVEIRGTGPGKTIPTQSYTGDRRAHHTAKHKCYQQHLGKNLITA